MPNWELCLFFFFVAATYATVGFGGGSSYLAILALYSVDFQVTRSTSLLCNIVVVAGGVWIFYRNGQLDVRKALPLIVASVPMAFLGGYLPIKETTFFLLLANTLIVAAILTWFQREKNFSQPDAASSNAIALPNPKSQIRDGVIGGGIGLLSGMVGIGGGIFLAPILYLTRWAAAKTIAATSSLFILVNSIAGLGGQMVKPDFQMDWRFALPLLAAVFLGGQIGSRLGAVKLPQHWVRRATALLILYVSVRLLLKYV